MISTSNKYNAQRVTFDGKTFDSRFEKQVYDSLKFYLGVERIKIHEPISIFKPTTLYPKGKYWKVDFEVITSKDMLYVEAKGRVNLETYWQFTALEAMRPEVFSRTIVVFNMAASYEKTLFKNFRRNFVQFDRFRFKQVLTFAEFIGVLTGIQVWA